ncbi:MAG: hypothetical protein QW589_01900 [Candidatus Bathyarchaeia archaeon]
MVKKISSWIKRLLLPRLSEISWRNKSFKFKNRKTINKIMNGLRNED